MKEKDPNAYPDNIPGDDPTREENGPPMGEELPPEEGDALLGEADFPPEDEEFSPAEEEGEFPEDGEDPAEDGWSPPPEDPAVATKRRRNTVLLNVLLAICVCGMVVAIIMLITIFRRYQVASNEYEGLQSSYAPAVSEEEQGPRFIDLAALRAVNPECIGWIEIPGTKIDYPLLYSPEDNYKYLEVTFEGTWNPSGAIFMDVGNSPDFTDVNTLITGHHMKDGSMFAGLASFMKEDYLNTHKEILIYTDEGIRHYEVFSASNVLTTDRPMGIWFNGPEDEAAFLAEMGGDTLALAPEDRIITLVTCVNSYDSSDKRYIVQAVFRSLEEMPEPKSSTSGSE